VRNGFNLAFVKRSIAIYQDKLIVATADAHVIALEAKTGKLIWDQPVADRSKGFMLTAGPLIAEGKVIQGISGSFGRQGGGPGIVGLDAATGRQLWRVNTIARPGEPGGNTWNDLPLEKRNGGSVWIPGSYDPTAKLVYFGVGQSYDITALRQHVDKPGVNNDALFTDTTLAIDPKTGKVVWYFQHLPNDLWDHDWSFERTIVTLKTPTGRPRQYVVTGGKEAIFEALDAKTGKYAFSYDFGLQSVVTAIDPHTGAKTINPNTTYYNDKSDHNTTCPTEWGARNLNATSYDAATNILYIALDPSCTEGVRSMLAHHGELAEGSDRTDVQLGEIAALNLETRQLVWTAKRRPPLTAALLATSGGVVFNGDLDRWFRANDARTGKELWKVRLNDEAGSFPITFAVDGRQYVAVAAGGRGELASAKASTAADIHLPPSKAVVLWVFALPQSPAAP
jgi:alcohol dehydrogenase (cytochrome c)